MLQLTLRLFHFPLDSPARKDTSRTSFIASLSHSHLPWKKFPLVFSAPWPRDKHVDETSEKAPVNQGGVDACCHKKRCVLPRRCQAANQGFIVPSPGQQDLQGCISYPQILCTFFPQKYVLAVQLLQICGQHTTCRHGLLAPDVDGGLWCVGSACLGINQTG